MKMKYCPGCGKETALKSIDGATRVVCNNPLCGYVHWNNPIPVVAALVQNEGKYIIARNVRWPKGVFSLITGYLEKGEHPEDAVLREVKEELGLDGEVYQFLGYHIFKEKNQLLLAFEIKASGSVCTNEELSELKYLTSEELSVYDFSPLYVTVGVINEWKKCEGQHS